MTDKIEVLDHGYVQLIEHWGSDQGVIEAARMSTGKGFKGWGPRCPKCGDAEDTSLHVCPVTERAEARNQPGDEKLLRYLWKNKHATPFEMAGLTFEVKAPIFIYRQWHRHRTQSYNEMSARYAPLPDENYIPSVDRLLSGGGHLTKQKGTVKGAAPLTAEQAAIFQTDLTRLYEEQERFYQLALKWGVPKELARVHLPVGRYSKMRASANLRNWLAFLTLRMDSHAQWEIQQYANAVGAFLEQRFPRTWALFMNGRADV